MLVAVDGRRRLVEMFGRRSHVPRRIVADSCWLVMSRHDGFDVGGGMRVLSPQQHPSGIRPCGPQRLGDNMQPMHHHTGS